MTLGIPVQYEFRACPTCGISFGMPAHYWHLKGDDGEYKTYCCPKGHKLHFVADAMSPESPKVKKLQREIARLLHEREQSEARKAAR